MPGLAHGVPVVAFRTPRFDPEVAFDVIAHAGIRNVDLRQQRMEACARNLSLPTLLVRGGLSDILSEDGARECPGSAADIQPTQP